MTPPKRAGFSLLEVLIATSILLGSVIVLGELARIGRKHATKAEEMAKAQRLCQEKLNEILSGLSAVDPVEEEVFTEEPNWTYTLQILPLEKPGLVALYVTVAPEPSTNLTTKPFTLVRWIPNPDGQQSVTSSQTIRNGESHQIARGPLR